MKKTPFIFPLFFTILIGTFPMLAAEKAKANHPQDVPQWPPLYGRPLTEMTANGGFEKEWASLGEERDSLYYEINALLDKEEAKRKPTRLPDLPRAEPASPKGQPLEGRLVREGDLVRAGELVMELKGGRERPNPSHEAMVAHLQRTMMISVQQAEAILEALDL